MSLMISNPYQFEEIIAELFSKMGYKTFLTKKSGDFGIDVIAKNDIDVIAIQVKLFNTGNNVGNGYVQKLLGAMQLAEVKATKSILITSSDFTIQAYEQGKELPIEYWNGQIIKDTLEKYFDEEIVFCFTNDKSATPIYEDIFPELPFISRSKQEIILKEIKKGPKNDIASIKMLMDMSNGEISLVDAKKIVMSKMISLGYTTEEKINHEERSGCILIAVIVIAFMALVIYYLSI